MISEQKKFTIILFVLSLFLFFSALPCVRADGIHSFSINNEGKYFIDYRDGLDANTVETFRSRLIQMMPIIEKWGGGSFDKLEIAIVPNSFDEYQATYGNTDIWKIMNVSSKEMYDGFWGRAAPERKKIIIKESAFNNSSFDHESCHLIQYPFQFDQYFSEGQANVCAMFIHKTLGYSVAYNDQSFENNIKKEYGKLSPKERKIYGASKPSGEPTNLNYAVGETFIEKLLEKSQADDLSALYTNLRSDFFEVTKKYEDYSSTLSFVTTNGQELPLPGFGFVKFSDPAGQEALMCEAIKSYGDKIASVFPEFGFPPPVNCDAKIKNFKKAKLDEFDYWMGLVKTGNVSGGKIVGHEKSIAQATESDKWKGSEVVKNENSRNQIEPWIRKIIIFVLIMVVTFPVIIAGIVLYFVFRKRKNKT